MFKIIRITILLLILASVISTLLIQKNIVRDWQGTLDIRIIPIIADQKKQTEEYVHLVTDEQFSDIKKYLMVEAKKHHLDLQHSLNIKLEDAITNIPPKLPENSSSRFDVMLWSLKLKWWAWRNQLEDHNVAQIRIYVLYQSPNEKQRLSHSTGLQNGLIGLVNVRASKEQQALHQIIIIHELLHIFGATDKYDFQNGLPNFPDGYARPQQKPLFPQNKAEMMARSIPVNNQQADVATSLNKIIIGDKTAAEIGWQTQSKND